jgi:hypothetical protein
MSVYPLITPRCRAISNSFFPLPPAALKDLQIGAFIRDYIGMRRPLDWLYRDFILGCFDAEVSKAQDRYRDFVTELVDRAYASPMKAVLGSALLGGADFISFIKKNYLSRRKPDKDLPALKQLEDRVAVKTICVEVEAAFSGPIPLFLSRQTQSLRVLPE